MSGHFHILGMPKPHSQCNATRKVATALPRFCNEPHPLHVLFVKVVAYLAPEVFGLKFFRVRLQP